MSAISYCIFVSGVILELCLLWRLLRNGIWRAYPYVSLYVVYQIVGTLGLFAVLRLSPALYRGLYWKSDVIDVALRFLVIWEVFRLIFPKGSGVQRVVSKGFGVIALGLILFAVGIFWSYQTYSLLHSAYPAMARSFGFAQAVMILGILLAARYYGLELGRNLRGIAVGFGAWISISTANNALIDLRHSFFLPYWRVLVPLSFVGMLGMWIWALWVYAPNPPIADQRTAEQVPEMEQWAKSWDQATSAARRVMHP